jgi:hypothetical protein
MKIIFAIAATGYGVCMFIFLASVGAVFPPFGVVMIVTGTLFTWPVEMSVDAFNRWRQRSNELYQTKEKDPLY